MAMRGVQDAVQKVGQVFDISSGEKDAIALLKDDHRRVELLFSRFERARSNKQSILDEIINELTVHASVEESLVYPLLSDQRKTHERTAEAYEEHHVVKTMLAELANLSAEQDIVKAKLKVLKEMVQHHVKEEESVLLPQLKRSGEDLDQLGREIIKRKRQLINRTARGGTAKTSVRRATATTRSSQGGRKRISTSTATSRRASTRRKSA